MTDGERFTLLEQIEIRIKNGGKIKKLHERNALVTLRDEGLIVLTLPGEYTTKTLPDARFWLLDLTPKGRRVLRTKRVTSRKK